MKEYMNRKGWLEFRIGKERDKRIKLTDKQKKEIFEKYKSGNYSQRELAREYGVSRRLIQFITDPSKLERDKQRRKENGSSKQYYDKERHKQYMRAFRRHIRDILDSEQSGAE